MYNDVFRWEKGFRKIRYTDKSKAELSTTHTASYQQTQISLLCMRVHVQLWGEKPKKYPSKDVLRIGHSLEAIACQL